jgi:hypothetical protein
VEEHAQRIGARPGPQQTCSKQRGTFRGEATDGFAMRIPPSVAALIGLESSRRPNRMRTAQRSRGRVRILHMVFVADVQLTNASNARLLRAFSHRCGQVQTEVNY